jgi:hypothetical protein
MKPGKIDKSGAGDNAENRAGDRNKPSFETVHFFEPTFSAIITPSQYPV